MKADTKHNLIKIAKKMLLLAGVLVALEFVYRFTFFPMDVREHCPLMRHTQIPIKEHAQVIYLGESSNRTHLEGESDTAYISEMVAQQMPEYRFGHISQDAAHANIYYDILRNIPKNNEIQMVIVTVNMRSFSSEWIYSNLENAFRKQQVFLQNAPALWRRLQLDLKMNHSWSEDERQQLVIEGFKQQTFNGGEQLPYHNAFDWDNATAWGEWLPNGQSLPADSIPLACHYIKNFAYELNDNNVRIQDFDRIVELCQQRNWQLVFNILPDNFDQIKRLVGNELVAIMQQANAYVVKRYTAKGVWVVNNENLVRDADFIDRDFPTEHYCAPGRKAVADNIVRHLKQR